MTIQKQYEPIPAYLFEKAVKAATVKVLKSIQDERIEMVGLLRCKQIIRLLNICESSFYKLVQHGVIPAGTKISKSCVLWKASDIQPFIDHPEKLTLVELD